MTISVIIPTFNGAHKILGVLRSLEEQTLPPQEVIVVIDGSTDGTAALLNSQQFSFQSFRVIEQPNGGRAQVRNRGAEEATNTLLVFSDDDMILPSEWLKSHHHHHQCYPDSIMSGMLKPYEHNESGEFSLFEAWLNTKWNSGLTKGQDNVVKMESPYLTACNFSIPRTIFFELNGFDRRLNDAEDYELAVRAIEKGIPLYFNAEAWSFHHDVGIKNFRNYIKRLRQYRIAHQKLLSLYPDTVAAESPSPKGIKKMIFELFASKFWIDSIEKKHFIWIPAKLRCKIYDIIVLANGTFFPDRANLD